MVRVVHIIGRMNVGGPAAIVTELLTHQPVDVHLLVGDVDADEADYLKQGDEIVPRGNVRVTLEKPR